MGVISEMLVKLGVDGSSIPGDMAGAKKAVLAGGVVIGAAAVASAKKLYDIGSVFDDVEDTIRVKTGATGKHLDSLTKSADRVGRSIPAKFEDIGTTIGELNQRLDLTGPTLEKVTKQFLEAGRMTDEALDVKTFSGAFNAFDVQAKQIPKTLDTIWRVSQATGVGMNDLASSVARNAPVLKQFDFSLTDSAALLGTLDKAGLNGNKTVATLSKALVEFAEQGKKPRAALEETIGKIEDFTKTGDDAKAINLAASIFGTRGATQFVAAVKSGKVNLDDLMGSTGATSDSILKASRDTADFSEKWQVFKNRVMLKLKPLAVQVFTAIGNGMDRLGKSDALDRMTEAAKRLVGAGRSVIDFFRQHDTVAKALAVTIAALIVVTQAHAAVLAVSAAGGLAAWIKQTTLATNVTKVWAAVNWALNSSLLANPIVLVVAGLIALGAALVLAYKKSETFRNIVDGVFGFLRNGVATAVRFVKRHWQLIGTILLGPIFYAAVQIVKHWDRISGAVRGGVSRVIGFVKGNWKAILATLIAGPFGLAVALVVKHWDRISGTVRTGAGKVLSYLRSVPGRIKNAFGDAGTLLWDIGQQVIRGLLNGIESMVGQVTGKLNGLKDKITHPFGRAAADKSALTPTGQRIMASLVAGISDGEDALDKKLGRVTDRIEKNLERRLDAIGKKVEKKQISKKLGKQLEAQARAHAKGLTATVKAAERSLSKLAGAYEKGNEELKKLRDDRASMAEGIASSISGELDLGSLITTSEPNAYGFGGGVTSTTFGAISGAVSGLAARAKKFAGKLQALLAAGIPKGLVQEVAGLGSQQGIAVADALLSGTSAQIASLASDYGDIATFAGKAGDIVAGAFFDDRISKQETFLSGLLSKPAIKKAAKSLAESLTDELIAALGINVGGKGGGAGRRGTGAVPIPRITPADTTGTGKRRSREEEVDELATRFAEALAKLGIDVTLAVDKKTATRIYRVGRQGAQERN